MAKRAYSRGKKEGYKEWPGVHWTRGKGGNRLIEKGLSLPQGGKAATCRWHFGGKGKENYKGKLLSSYGEGEVENRIPNVGGLLTTRLFLYERRRLETSARVRCLEGGVLAR